MSQMAENVIYLDHNATTPLDPVVAEAMHACALRRLANPASQHEPGRQARRVLEQARERIAWLLGASTEGTHTDHVIFTSGATEANNLAIRGLAGEPPGEIIVSVVEHPSVIGPAEFLARHGFQLRLLPVNRHGVVQVDALDELMTPNTRLVSVMLGNHETGALQPVDQIARTCAAAGVPLHTDAVQVAGKLPLSFNRDGMTAMSVSAHKSHGPRGIGALILRHGTSLAPQTLGGFQQAGLRPGTEPIELPVGMATALEQFHANQTHRIRHLSELRNSFETALSSHWPSIVINSAGADRLPHTSNVSFPGFDRQALVMALDLAGVACSTGTACASGSSEPSPVLQAMGCNESILGSAIRFSFGAFTQPAEVDQAVALIGQILSDLQSRNRQRKSASPAPRRLPNRI
jgi:cysteine desulfurase